MDTVLILCSRQSFTPFINAKYSDSLFVLTPTLSANESRIVSLFLIRPPIPALIGL